MSLFFTMKERRDDMKKVFIVLLALLLVSCASAPSYKEGQYEGVSNGFQPNLKVEVSVDSEGKISDVQVIEHQESANEIPAVSQALEEIPKAIVEKNSTEVDAVSGASRTSEGIMNAVEDALSKAK